MDLSVNRRRSQHNLTMDNRGEVFQVAKAMGVTLSAAKLVVHSLTERQWPMTIRMDTDSLQELAEGFSPLPTEISTYMESLGQAASLGANVVPLPVRPIPEEEASRPGVISQ